jgi:hypothetical protein
VHPPADTLSPRLRDLARRATGEREAALERCDLCGAPIDPAHRHLLDTEKHELMCACKPCSLLFDRGAAGGGHFRLVPDRRLRVADLELGDALWEELRLPVDIAFFVRTAHGGARAFYPGPMGATESQLVLEAWEQLEARNPVLTTLERDVEALLVSRPPPHRGERRHWVVPIDECYRLAGLIRSTWSGLTGGKVVWQELARFYDALDARARPVTRDEGGS